MKILLTEGNGAAKVYRQGWANAFSFAKHECVFWNVETTPAFDAFDYDPDFFIGTTWELNAATIQCIKDRPNMYVALAAPNWGEDDKIIDPGDTVMMASNKEIDLVKTLLEQTGRPNYLFTYYHQNQINHTHTNWQEMCPVFGIPLAADLIDHFHKNAKFEKVLECDIAFCGGYWPYKGQELRKYLIALEHMCSEFRIKICSRSKWPSQCTIGDMSPKRQSNLYKSAKVCPCIYEPLSPKYGFDVSERIFKVISSGGLAISQYIHSLAHDLFDNNEIPIFRNFEEFKDLCSNYCEASPEERYNKWAEQYDTVIHKHTYFDRCSRFFSLLGLYDQSDIMFNCKSQFL